MAISIKLQSKDNDRKKVLISSILFMGLGHILYLKQYLKGLFYAFTEALFLIFLPKITTVIGHLRTLGESQPHLPIKERANSIFMLIDGVIVLAVIVAFIAIYIISVRSALVDYTEASGSR